MSLPVPSSTSGMTTLLGCTVTLTEPLGTAQLMFRTERSTVVPIGILGLLSRYRTPLLCGNPSTASCCCPACAWLLARRHEPDPASCRDPRGRRGRLFTIDG